MFLDNSEDYMMGSIKKVIPEDTELYNYTFIQFTNYRLYRIKIAFFEEATRRINRDLHFIKKKCEKYKGTKEYEFYLVCEVLKELAKRYIYDTSVNNVYNIEPFEKMPWYYNDYKTFKCTLIVYFLGNGVCNSYATLVDYFLKRLNIKTVYVSSKTHSWNKVELNGKWYNLDITWDRDEILAGKVLLNSFRKDNNVSKYKIIKEYSIGIRAMMLKSNELERMDNEYFKEIIKRFKKYDPKEFESKEDYNKHLVLKTFSRKIKLTKNEKRFRSNAKKMRKKMGRLVTRFKKLGRYTED